MSVLAVIVGIGIWESSKYLWRRSRPKGLRFPNGIPRAEVPLDDGQMYRDGATPVALFRSEPAVAVFSIGPRVEVLGKQIDVSVPLSGAVINVADHAGTKLWQVEFVGKDKDGS